MGDEGGEAMPQGYIMKILPEAAGFDEIVSDPEIGVGG
jgi:hypothetical protein